MVILLLAICFFGSIYAMDQYNPNFDVNLQMNSYTVQQKVNTEVRQELVNIRNSFTNFSKRLDTIHEGQNELQKKVVDRVENFEKRLSALEKNKKPIQPQPTKLSQFMGKVYDHLSENKFKNSKLLLRRFAILATPLLALGILYKWDFRGTNNKIKLLNLELKHGKITELEYQSLYNKLVAFKFDDSTIGKIAGGVGFTIAYHIVIHENRFW